MQVENKETYNRSIYESVQKSVKMSDTSLECWIHSGFLVGLGSRLCLAFVLQRVSNQRQLLDSGTTALDLVGKVRAMHP